MRVADIKDRVIGRWRGLLPLLGIPDRFLTGKHGPCPLCNEGKDRFRFADAKGMGTWYCSQCGDTARSGYGGTGWDLVMRLHRIEFHEAKKMVAPYIDTAPVIMPRTADLSQTQERYMGLWKSGEPLSGEDLASQYLAKRGIVLDRYPNQLRFLPNMPLWSDRKSCSYHPAMMALFVGPEIDQRTLHITYLDDDGNKLVQPGWDGRKLAPGPVPRGGAIRLAPSSETMGIAEGIETALSAMLLHDVPVWAAMTAGVMLNWQPPPHVKNVIVFADNDLSFTGQSAAYSLAHKLKLDGKHVDVRLPDMAYAGKKGADFNDVLRMEGRQ